MRKTELPELYPGWRTVRKIGSGSFGTVYEIERDLFGKIEKAALKCIVIPQNDSDVEEMYSNGYDDASITAHFENCLAKIVREYSLMAEMKGYTNIVYCDDIRYTPRENGIGWEIFIKMELLIPLLKTLSPDFSEAQVIRLGKDLCRALVLCKERDIVHRDIKPQNIFVSKTGDYKLGDFGIAKTVEQTTGGTKIGTYSYMAPEVYHNRPYGSSTDIYSLGLVMYWLLNERRLPFMPLSSKVPTHEETEQAKMRRFNGERIPAPAYGSDALQEIVLKACAYDPGDRYTSAGAMLEALEKLEITQKLTGERDSRGIPGTDEDDKTIGVVFRDREKERLAKEQEEVESLHRMLEVNEHQRKKQEEQNRKWEEMVARRSDQLRHEELVRIACIALAALLALMGLFLLIRGSGEKPVMMPDSFSGYDWNEEEQKFVPHDEPLVLGSQTPRAKIRSITFLDTLKNAPDDSWDVSFAQDSSVQAWVEPAGDLYDLYIAGEGGVRAPQDCRLLFAGYSSVESINLNDCLDTSQVTDMGGMFRACAKLTKLDLNSWDTSHVTNMSSMFWSCNSIEELNVDNWNTSQVTDMTYMFRSCTKLTDLNLNSWDTSQVMDMRGMLRECTSLTELNISDWDTSQVTVMGTMFYHCTNLTALNIGDWDTQQVTEMGCMFEGCATLTELNIGEWDTSQLITAYWMFSGCSNLAELNIGDWDTSRVQHMSYMFNECYKLTKLDLSDWDTSNVTSMNSMFQDCYGLFAWDEAKACYVLDGLNIWNWNVDKVEEYQSFVSLGDKSVELYGEPWEYFFSAGEKPVMMSDSFSGYAWNVEEQKYAPHEEPLVLGSQIPRAKIRSITFLDTLKNAPDDRWDVSLAQDSSVQAWVVPTGDLYDLYIAGEGGVLAPQDCRLLFASYTALESINLNGCFDTSQVTDMGQMFRACVKLTALDLSSWDTSQVTSLRGIFNDCTSLTELNISDWDTSRVMHMYSMFQGCNNLTELDLNSWDTSQVTNMSGMFQSCTNLTKLNIGNWDTSQVTDMSGMFDCCSSFRELDIGNWDTSQVQNMGWLFNGCNNLTELDLNSWDTSQVTNMSGMFHACTNLTKLNIGSWDTSQVQYMSNMFEFCHDLEELDIGNWDTSQVTDMTGMFDCCSSFRELDIGNWDTSQVQNMSGIFNECCALTELDLSGWDTSQVQNMAWLFRCCENLTYLDLSNWDTSQVQSMNCMFESCGNLTKLDLSDWDTSKVTNMESMFQNCYGLFVWDESKACYVLDGLNIRNWNVDKVEACQYFVSLGDKNVELYGAPWEDFFK